MIYNVEDKLSFKQTLVYSLQQFLAVVCATILVPILCSGNGVNMSPAAALFGAGIATLFYVWVTKKKSPIFIGSSFAFISALIGATQYGLSRAAPGQKRSTAARNPKDIPVPCRRTA